MTEWPPPPNSGQRLWVGHIYFFPWVRGGGRMRWAVLLGTGRTQVGFFLAASSHPHTVQTKTRPCFLGQLLNGSRQGSSQA